MNNIDIYHRILPRFPFTVMVEDQIDWRLLSLMFVPSFFCFLISQVLLCSWEQIANKSLFCQVLSRPLLVLSIATVFSDQSECSDGKSDCSADSHDSVAYSELSSVQADMNTRYISVLNLYANICCVLIYSLVHRFINTWFPLWAKNSKHKTTFSILREVKIVNYIDAVCRILESRYKIHFDFFDSGKSSFDMNDLPNSWSCGSCVIYMNWAKISWELDYFSLHN